MPPFEQRPYLSVNGGSLEVSWYGPPPGETPTLVFLHEGLGCVALWRDFPQKLSRATGCGAFVFSRFGYGGSDPCHLPRPVTFMHEEGLHVLPDVLKAAGIREHILIGHSDGGSIALIYAGGTPAYGLMGVITEAAHVYTEEMNLESIRLAKQNYQTGDLREKLKKYHGKNVDCAFYGWNGAWLHPDFVNWNLEAFLPGIRVPLLVIQGEDDPYGTPAQVESIVRNTGGPAESLLLPDCRHNPHFDKPHQTLEAMTCFVKDLLD